jgi:hypothetical protein
MVLAGCKSQGVCWTRVEVDGKATRELPIVQIAFPVPQASDAAPDRDAIVPTETQQTCAARESVLVNGTCVPLDSLVRRRLAPLELKPGHHVLLFTGKGTNGEVRGELDCAAGDVVYAILEGTILQSYSLAQQLRHGFKMSAATGSVTFSRVAPGGPTADSVVIYYEGEWLVSH